MSDQTSPNKRSFLAMQGDAPKVIQAKSSVHTSAISQTCRQGNNYVAIRRNSKEKSYVGEGANEKNHDDSMNCIFESWNSAKKYLDATKVKAEHETFQSLEEAVLYAFGKSGSGAQRHCNGQERMEVEGLLEEEPTSRSTGKATTLSAVELLPQEILNAIYSYICLEDEVDTEMLDYARVYSFLCGSMRLVSKRIHQSCVNFVQQVHITFHTAPDPSSDCNKMEFFKKNKARVGAVCVGTQGGYTTISRMIVSLFTLKFLDISSMKQLQLMSRVLKPPDAGQLWDLAKHGGVPLELIRENEGSKLEDFSSIIYNILINETKLSLRRLEVRVDAKSFEAFHRFITSHAKNQLVHLWVEINLGASIVELSPTLRKIEGVVERAPCLEQLRLDVFLSGNGVHELCLNSSSLRSLQLGDPEEAMQCDSQCPLFSIGDNVNCPNLTALDMIIPHLGNPFDPFLITEGRTFAAIEDLTLRIVPPTSAGEEVQGGACSFAQKILNAIGQMPKLKTFCLDQTCDSLKTLAFNSASVEKVTIGEGYEVSLSEYKLTGSSITELNIEVLDIRSFDTICLETPNLIRLSIAVLNEEDEDDEFDVFRQDLKRSAMQKLSSIVENGLPKLEVLHLYSSDVVCDGYTIKSETLKELTSNVIVLNPMKNCPKLTKLNGQHVRH